MSVTIPPTHRSTAGPTLEELFQRFGAIPAARIRMDRYPATEQDVLDVHAKENRLCELVDDLLVEKAMGFIERVIAINLAALIKQYLAVNDIGIVAGEGGMMKLASRLVRIPDLSFASWKQFPGGKPTRQTTPAIPSIYPDLAVEVLSDSNTPKEMEEKRNDYFDAGTQLVWIIDPELRTLAVYTLAARHTPTIFNEADAVLGDLVLPGFAFVVGRCLSKRSREALARL